MAALPFGTIVIIIVIWTLVTVPLTVFMGVTGKNGSTEFYAPCRTNKYPREVPELPWYRATLPQMAMAGFLPFSAIYVELYYIFASVWGHKVYVIWSILFIVFLILIVVTAFITVALTYFQLAVEDHRWWWRSFLCGGSTGEGLRARDLCLGARPRRARVGRLAERCVRVRLLIGPVLLQARSCTATASTTTASAAR